MPIQTYVLLAALTCGRLTVFMGKGGHRLASAPSGAALRSGSSPHTVPGRPGWAFRLFPKRRMSLARSSVPTGCRHDDRIQAILQEIPIAGAIRIV